MLSLRKGATGLLITALVGSAVAESPSRPAHHRDPVRPWHQGCHVAIWEKYGHCTPQRLFLRLSRDHLNVRPRSCAFASCASFPLSLGHQRCRNPYAGDKEQ